MERRQLELVGVQVTDLDVAIEAFTAAFGCDFMKVVPGVDLEIAQVRSDTSPDPAPTGRAIAFDRNGMFQLTEMPEGVEGMRNVHVRVDDIELMKEHLLALGHTLAQDVRVGAAREAVFIGPGLHGVRLALVQYDGPSFVEAAVKKAP